MKNKLITILLMVVLTFTMTFGSTMVSWAGDSSLAEAESMVKSALASQTLKGTDEIYFFIYNNLPASMKGEPYYIENRSGSYVAPTEKSEGSIQFAVIFDNGDCLPIDDEGDWLIARIEKKPKEIPWTTDALTKDIALISKAVGKLTVSNNLSKETIFKTAKNAIQNGSTISMRDNFYKKDATTYKDGKIWGYLDLSDKTKDGDVVKREFLYNKTIPMLKTKMPNLGSKNLNLESWRLLYQTNLERYRYGLKLVTMTLPFQKAGAIRGPEVAKKYSHTRPNGKSCFTAFPKMASAGENIYKVTGKGNLASAEKGIVSWMHSPGHRKNILTSKWNYAGFAIYKTVGVQMFGKSNATIKKYTTSAGKIRFKSVADMEKEYLIFTDTAGVKSYLPLNTDYMKKVSGGYTVNVKSKKTVKIYVDNNPNEFVYDDVSAADREAVKWVTSNKVMAPYNKDEFEPNFNVIKGDLFCSLYRVNGKPREGFKNTDCAFPDVKYNDQYYTALRWALKKGHITSGLFEGEMPILRGYGLYYIWKSAGSPKAKTKATFTDYDPNVFYAQAVAWAQEKGLIKDNGDHKFAGHDVYFTRIEAARILHYVYKDKKIFTTKF